MHEYLNIGTNLYHKYLSVVIVIEIYEDRIKVDTGSHGILEFAFYDFGKVLFFEKSHSNNGFESYQKYLDFCDKEKRLKMLQKKIQREREKRRLKETKKLEIKKNEFEKQRLIDEQKKQSPKQNKDNKIEYSSTIDEFSSRVIKYDFTTRMENVFPKRQILLKIKKGQEEKLKEITNRRKIEYILHFTRIDNLHSILQNGLIPVSMQPKMKIRSLHNDDQRIDSKLDCTSCSIGFPNYKLFYTFREYKYPGTSWVIIVIDKDVLFSSLNIVYYCQTNAARVFSRVSSVKELCTAAAFENMFCNYIMTKENKMIKRSVLKIGDNITTDPQAEILISDIINKEYIRCIYFQNQLDVDSYISKNGQDLLDQYGHQIVPKFFNAREDYMFWKKES